MFSALKKISPSHLLDSNLYDFKTLSKDIPEDGEGDTAFDPDPLLNQPTVSQVIELKR